MFVVAHMAKKFAALTESDDSLPCSEKRATQGYTDPVQQSTSSHIVSLRWMLILSSINI
jgi:hypothetical protein